MANEDGDRYSVFVSYAHIDNLPLPGADTGWVSCLSECLEKRLTQRMGVESRIWFDEYELRGNHAVTPEIEAKVARSETFVAVLSPGYLNSTWCRRELEIFREQVGEVSSKRIFVVEIDNIDRQTRHDLSIGDVGEYPFWFWDRNKRMKQFGIPAPRKEEGEYYSRVFELAEDVASALQEFHRSGGASGTSKAGAPDRQDGGKSVVLAEVTHDLEVEREQLRRHLEQADVGVRTCSSLGLTADEYEAALVSNFDGADLFVQLLSRVVSMEQPDAPQGYAALQEACARENGIRTLHWRDPELDISGVDDVIQSRLLQLPSVHAVPFETFKRAVIQELDDAESIELMDNAPSIFINAERRDLLIAEQIYSDVGNRLTAALPLTSGTSEELRSHLEHNIMCCDGLVVVYGNGTERWVQEQLRLYNKYARRREKPVKLLAVVDAAPEDTPDLGFSLPGMRVFKCRDGIDSETINTICGQMNGGAA